MSIAIKIENLSKQYRLGLVSTRTLSHDLNRWWQMNIRGKDDPYLKIGETNDRTTKGVSEYVWALKDINLEVEEGEVLGIIGKNGAGKSTLLKILSKVTAPTTGIVKARGRIASLLEVGTGFHQEMTGRENIFMNGSIMGMTKAEIKKKFDEIVDFAGIERYIDTPVKRYSSGMIVRLGFSIAAHLEPEILVVDEVLAVGDMEFRKKSLGKMKNVSQAGKTVLFVSHDMGSITNLCPVTLWLDSGNIKSIGESKEIISQYVTNATFFGGEVSWANIDIAPGNENVRLKAVRIKSNGDTTADVMIDKEIRIEVDYWNLKDGAILASNFHLRDKMDNFVLASINMPSACLSADPWAEKPRHKGLFRTICIIPANFLNSENYSFDIGILNGRQDWQIWEKNILTFSVHESGEMKKEYMGSWIGVVRPKLSWSTIPLDEGLTK
jgi:lipopolysaccharide transport system ATP-binding protein